MSIWLYLLQINLLALPAKYYHAGEEKQRIHHADTEHENIELEFLTGKVRKFSRTIKQAGDNIFMTEFNGIIKYVNMSFESTSRFTKEEALGKGQEL